MADTAFYCILSHEGVLAVRGPDANKFLQGQVTCNLNYLSDSYSSLGARCTPKGRMQSSFRVLSVSDGYLLAMASDLLDAQLTDLKKYAVFSKSKLTDESQDWLRIGLNGADDILRSLGLELAATADSVARRDDLLALRLSDGRAELWIPADQATAVQAQVASQLPEAPLNDWLLAQVRAGIGQVVGSTRELFIPQMINLQAVGGVSFKKGCYTARKLSRACSTWANSSAACIAWRCMTVRCPSPLRCCSRRRTPPAWVKWYWPHAPQTASSCLPCYRTKPH